MSKKIVMLCANGFTTTMLRNKIREEIEKAGLDYTVDAYPLTEIETVAVDADMILLGPQVRFQYSKTKAKYANIPVEMIDSQALAFADGKKILKQITDQLS